MLREMMCVYVGKLAAEGSDHMGKNSLSTFSWPNTPALMDHLPSQHRSGNSPLTDVGPVYNGPPFAPLFSVTWRVVLKTLSWAVCAISSRSQPSKGRSRSFSVFVIFQPSVLSGAMIPWELDTSCSPTAPNKEG